MEATTQTDQSSGPPFGLIPTIVIRSLSYSQQQWKRFSASCRDEYIYIVDTLWWRDWIDDWVWSDFSCWRYQNSRWQRMASKHPKKQRNYSRRVKSFTASLAGRMGRTIRVELTKKKIPFRYTGPPGALRLCPERYYCTQKKKKLCNAFYYPSSNEPRTA